MEAENQAAKKTARDNISKAALAGLVIGGAIIMVLTNHEIPVWMIVGISTILVYYFGLQTTKPN